MNNESSENSALLYAVNDKPPHLLSALLGFQTVALILSGIVIVPLIALTAAGADDNAKNWAVFAALLISGVITILQARPIGSFGSGYVLFMGTSGAFLAVSIAALIAGGLPLLSTLIVCSSLIQFVFSKRLGLIRKIVTPTVGGTVITLIAVAVMPIAFKMINQLPQTYEGSPTVPVWMVVFTIMPILFLSLFGKSQLRLWAPVIGVLSGSAVAFFFGLVDLSAISNAKLFGLPNASWPGLDTRFNETFWVMLPGFMIVTIVGALETYGDGIAIQQVSQRGNQPTDFKAIQGAINADGLGNLLSGLVGTLPNTTYSTSVAVADLTGVAARRVGIYGGLFLILIALSPKVSALLQAIPGPVAGSFIFFIIVLLFVHGISLIARDGISFDNSIVFGVSLWVGYGFQAQLIFHDLMPSALQQLLDNGMTSGGITAVLLSWLVTLKQSKSSTLIVAASEEMLPDTTAFTKKQGEALNWSRRDLSRLELMTEEAFLYLVEKIKPSSRLKVQLKIRNIGDKLEIEMMSSSSGENIENLIENMQPIDTYSEDDLRIRILSGMVEQLSHQQFNEQDFLSMTIARKDALLAESGMS